VGLGGTSGAQAGSLTITANRQSLALGMHTAQISITDDRRNRNVTFPVTFEHPSRAHRVECKHARLHSRRKHLRRIH
jgi:hypothetical protein